MSRTDDDDEDVGPAASTAKAPKPWTMPGWLDHFNSGDLKILFRCWVAVWVALILNFIQPSLRNLGQAAFFGALLLMIVPPAYILFVYLLLSLSLLLGMCLAWAWGLLTMKAAMAARPDAESMAMLQSLQQQAMERSKQTGGDPKWEAQVLVYHGFMLDARVTAVFYVMGCAFIYFLARLKSNNPKLIFAQLFGTIVTDLFILYGPSLPSYNASVASILVKPGAIGVGLGAACCLLFFPQSTSYVVLHKMEQLVRLLHAPIKSTKAALARNEVSLQDLKASRGAFISLYKSTDPLVAFLPLDFSRGRWNADDVDGLRAQVREAMAAGLSLIDFHISRGDYKAKKAVLEKHKVTPAEEKDMIGHHQLLESADLMYALGCPEQFTLHAHALETLASSTAPIFPLCSQSVDIVARCIHMVNTSRWIGQPSQSAFDGVTRDLQDTIAALRDATDQCALDTTEGIIRVYADIFDENGQLNDPDRLGPASLRGLSMAMILEERILSVARKLESLMDFTLKLMRARTVHRIWLPSRLRYGLSWLWNRTGTLPAVSTSTAEAQEDPNLGGDPSNIAEQASEAYRRLHVSQGYPGSSVRRSPVSRALAASLRWLSNPAGMFALRMVAVTVVTSLPSAFRHSAGFFFREKGIWAVISAQTCVVVYMADFTFSVVSRLIGTIFGGVLGMLAWYMGSGSGHGNPYGLAASSGLMLVILLWLRIFLPPSFAKATILSGATFCLVVGFSYDAHKIKQFGLPGEGYETFWKRVVTVLIGFFAATIIQVLPKPPSSTLHVSKSLANTVRTLSDHYALLLSHWGRTSKHSPLRVVADEISIAVADLLLSLSEPIYQLKFEFTLSPFNHKVLSQTREQCQYMNQALRRLLNLSTSLPTGLQDRLVQTVGFTDDRVVGDIMAVLGIIEQSLRTGSPLPERLPAPLVNRFYDSWNARKRPGMMSVEFLRDENYRRYCVTLSSYLRFLSSIDELVLILKSRLGECHVIHAWEDDV